MRKNISVTIDEEHVVALDAEKDKYTTRSDVLNKILDAYFSAGLDPKDFSVGESSGMSVRTKLAVSTSQKRTNMIPREFERTYSVGTKINKIDLEKLKIVCRANNLSLSEFIFYIIKENLRKNDGFLTQVIEEEFDGQISKLIEKEDFPYGDDLP